MSQDTVHQGVQVGLETVKGTAVAATKRFSSLGFTWNDQNTIQRVRPIGRLLETGANRNRQWTEMTGQGAFNFNEGSFLFDSLIKTATPVNGAGGDAGAWTRIYTLNNFGADAYSAATFERGIPGASGARAAWGHCIGAELTANSEDLSVSSDWLARETVREHTVTSVGVTDFPDNRAFSNMVNIYIDEDVDDLGDTQIADPWASAWRLQGRRGKASSLNRANKSWSKAPTLAPTAEFDIRVSNDSDADMFEDYLDSQEFLYIRWQAQGPLIVGTKNYLLQFDMACKVVQPSAPADEQGIDSKLYTLVMAYDSDWAKGFEVTLVNKMATSFAA